MSLRLNRDLELRLEPMAAETHRTPTKSFNKVSLAVEQVRAAARRGGLIDHELATQMMDKVIENG